MNEVQVCWQLASRIRAGSGRTSCSWGSVCLLWGVEIGFLNILHRKPVTGSYIYPTKSNNSVPYWYSTVLRIRDSRLPSRCKWDLRSSEMLLLRGGILQSNTTHLYRKAAPRHIQAFARLRVKTANPRTPSPSSWVAGTKPPHPVRQHTPSQAANIIYTRTGFSLLTDSPHSSQYPRRAQIWSRYIEATWIILFVLHTTLNKRVTAW